VNRRQAGIAAVMLLVMTTLGFAQGAQNKAAAKAGGGKSKAGGKPSHEALIAREKTLWEAVKNGDAEGFKKEFIADYAGVNEDGVHTLEEDVKPIGTVKLRSYSLNDIKVALPATGTAVLTYKATVQGDYQGHDFSGDYYCMSVWVSRGGKWAAAAHSEVRAAKAP